MITQPQLNMIIKSVIAQTGFNPIGRTRKREIVRARQIMVMIAVSYYYKSKPYFIKNHAHTMQVPGCFEIGKLTGFNHATIINCYKSGNDHYECEKDFKADYDMAFIIFKELVNVNVPKPCRAIEYKFIPCINDIETKMLLIGKRV